jgi:hypothetical protein
VLWTLKSLWTSIKADTWPYDYEKSWTVNLNDFFSFIFQADLLPNLLHF